VELLRGSCLEGAAWRELFGRSCLEGVAWRELLEGAVWRELLGGSFFEELVLLKLGCTNLELSTNTVEIRLLLQHSY
jgi:hypothetical protein